MTSKSHAITKPALKPLAVFTSTDYRVLAALMFTVVVWSSAFAAIRAGLEAYTPVHVALLRYLVASAALGIYALMVKMPLPQRRDLPGIALSGFLGITLYNVALNTGEVTVSAGVASFLIAMAPVFVALLARMFLRERLRMSGWLGIALSFSGVAVIALGKTDHVSVDTRALLILVAALAQALFVVVQKNYLTRYTPFQFVTYAIWSGTVFLAVFAPGLPDALRGAPTDATLSVVYMGIVPGAVGYVSYAYALARIPANRGASFLYLVPLFAMFIAWVWLGEVPPVISVFGGLLVLSGVVIVNFYGRMRK